MTNVAVEDKLWFKHPTRVWDLGTVTSRRGREVALADSTGVAFIVPLEDTHEVDVTHLTDSDDIANMNNMHEAPLLHLLRMRYMSNKIYTFTGEILISVNPYLLIPDLYTIPEQLVDFSQERTPHVYAIADKAYRMMMFITDPARKNQSLIVSGESGAGKTEACKHVMRYLAAISEHQMRVRASMPPHVLATSVKALMDDQNRLPTRASAATTLATTVRVEKRVLDCNPFLEAFGNAKTVRNDNSSRFGKFLKIEYVQGRIAGASMEHYLLEKARVVTPCPNERNYHIFYQVVRGATAAEHADWGLSYEPADYPYLASCTSVPGVDDSAEFKDVRDAMLSVGIAEETQSQLFAAIAGILHLGRLQFRPVAGAQASCEVSNTDVCDLAGRLLGVENMGPKLVQRMVAVQGRASCYVVQLDPEQAAAGRDALAKSLYERIFAWLVDQVNAALGSPTTPQAFVGILDIFGFEIFEHNSFEQLCINFANEKLQSLFNHHIFVMEQEQYKAEGVDSTAVTFVNNQPCVDLIEAKPFGLLPLLDEVCMLGRKVTDDKLLDSMDAHHKDKHAYYVAQKVRRTLVFGVRHFAGEVHYHVDGFIDKNNDTLYPDLAMLMQTSKAPFVATVFLDKPDPAEEGAGGPAAGAKARTRRGGASGGRKAVSTIASKFKQQLASLNTTILATSPHYVRCLKPNTLKKAHTFDDQMVLAQLLYAGVLETVRIRREGYPFRETFVEFWRRCTNAGYQRLAPGAERIPLPPRPDYGPDGVDRSLTPAVVAAAVDGTKAVCGRYLPADIWLMGHTKVFMKGHALGIINTVFRTHASVVIQAWYRCRRAVKRYKRCRRGFCKLQRHYKGVLLRRRFAAVAGKMTILQAHVRRRSARRKFIVRRNKFRNSIFTIQAFARRVGCRGKYLRARRGTVRLQARGRGLLVRRRVKRMHKAAVKIQAIARGRFVRKVTVRVYAAVRIQAAARGALARKRARRLRAVRANGCVRIQAVWKRHAATKRYKKIRKAVRNIQRVGRGHLGRKTAQHRLAALVKIQSTGHMFLCRCRFLHIVHAITRLQAAWIGRLVRHELATERDAAFILTRRLSQIHSSKILVDWTQELHAACTWGDVSEVSQLLKMTSDKFRSLRSIPMTQRARIRNRVDGLKTTIHSAAVSASLETVQLLVNSGADVTAVDMAGATALHTTAAAGDSHLAITKYLLASCGSNVKAFINRRNVSRETALDCAVSQLKSGGRHRETVLALQGAGGESAKPVPAELLAASNAAGDGLERQIIMEAEKREVELLERRRKERMDDPHYQFLFVADQERSRQATAAQRSAEQAKELAQREASRLRADRVAMEAADEYSLMREIAERAAAAQQARQKQEAIRAAERAKAAAEAEAAKAAAAAAEAARAAAAAAAESAAQLEARKRAEEVSARVSAALAAKKRAAVLAAADVETIPAQSVLLPGANKSNAGTRPAVSTAAPAVATHVVEAPVTSESQGRSVPPLSMPDAEEEDRPVSSGFSSERSAGSPHVVGGSAGGAQSSSVVPPASGDVWEEHETDAGYLYYFNPATGVTQWTPPPKGSIIVVPQATPEPEADSGEWEEVQSPSGLIYYHHIPTGKTQWDPPAGWQAEPEPTAAPVWHRHFTPDGVAYYARDDTGESQWVRPADYHTDDDDDQFLSDDDEDGLVGNNGWVSFVGKDGYVFYHNELTKQTQWERPVDF